MMTDLFPKILKKYSIDSLLLSVPGIVNIIIALFTLPIILSSLSIVHYGKWQFILALEVWLIALTGGNITRASKRGIIRGLNGTFLYGFLVRLKFFLLLGVLIFGAAFYLKLAQYYIFSALLGILGFYLIFGYLFQVSFYEFLIAKKRFRDWCFWQIIMSLVSIGGSTLIAYLTKNIIYFVLFQLGSISVLSLLVWFWILKKENLIGEYKKGKINKECVPYGLKLIPVDLIGITSNKVAHFVIGFFFGFANLAIFSVANQLKDKCSGIFKNIRSLLYADFAKMEKKKLIEIVNRHLVKTGLFGIFLTLGVVITGWVYIKFFLPESFYPAIFYFAILALGIPARIMIIVLRTVLESHLLYKELAAVDVVSSLLKIGLILIFGISLQILGICIALALGDWIIFIFYYFLTLKREVAINFIHKISFLKKLSRKY